jgi:hypothetical protein
VALSRLSVAGRVEDLTLDVPGTVGRIAVTGALLLSDLSAGYGPGARLGSLSAGHMERVRVATRHLPSLAVTGSAALGAPGDVRDCFFEVLGSVGGVGLGTVAIKGTVARSTFRVDDGDVVSFAAAVFQDSDLLVGVRLDRPDDLSGGGVFTANHTIRSFQTTRPFDPADPDSFSFRRSMVAAAKLGTITLTGVDPVADDVFGVGFALSEGAAGTVRTAGVLRTSGFTDGAFAYGGL